MHWWMCNRRPWPCVRGVGSVAVRERLQRLSNKSRLTKPQFPLSFVPPTVASSCLVTCDRGGYCRHACLLTAFPRVLPACLSRNSLTNLQVLNRQANYGTLTSPVPPCIPYTHYIAHYCTCHSTSTQARRLTSLKHQAGES